MWLSYTHTHIYVCIHILSHYSLSQDIEYSSLGNSVGPCCLDTKVSPWHSRSWWFCLGTLEVNSCFQWMLPAYMSWGPSWGEHVAPWNGTDLVSDMGALLGWTHGPLNKHSSGVRSGSPPGVNMWPPEQAQLWCRIWVQVQILPPSSSLWASLIAQMVKNPTAIQETLVWFLGQEDPLEKG